MADNSSVILSKTTVLGLRAVVISHAGPVNGCHARVNCCSSQTNKQTNANLLRRWMDGWLGFNGILSTQVAAISCLRKFKVY